MAKKRAAISDLIKGDMSRRAIGRESAAAENRGGQMRGGAELFPGERPEKKPAEKAPRAAGAAPPDVSGFMAFLAEQTQTASLTDPDDLGRLYDFLQNQAARYIKGFCAGRRFYGSS